MGCWTPWRSLSQEDGHEFKEGSVSEGKEVPSSMSLVLGTHPMGR